MSADRLSRREFLETALAGGVVAAESELKSLISPMLQQGPETQATAIPEQLDGVDSRIRVFLMPAIIAIGDGESVAQTLEPEGRVTLDRFSEVATDPNGRANIVNPVIGSQSYLQGLDDFRNTQLESKIDIVRTQEDQLAFVPGVWVRESNAFTQNSLAIDINQSVSDLPNAPDYSVFQDYDGEGPNSQIDYSIINVPNPNTGLMERKALPYQRTNIVTDQGTYNIVTIPGIYTDVEGGPREIAPHEALVKVPEDSHLRIRSSLGAMLMDGEDEAKLVHNQIVPIVGEEILVRINGEDFTLLPIVWTDSDNRARTGYITNNPEFIEERNNFSVDVLIGELPPQEVAMAPNLAEIYETPFPINRVQQYESMTFLVPDMTDNPRGVRTIEWVATPEQTEAGWDRFWTQTYYDLITRSTHITGSDERRFTRAQDGRTYAEVFGVNPETVTVEQIAQILQTMEDEDRNLPLVPVGVYNSSNDHWGDPNKPLEIIPVPNPEEMPSWFNVFHYERGTGDPMHGYGLQVKEDGTIQLYYYTSTSQTRDWTAWFYGGLQGLKNSITTENFIENPYVQQIPQYVYDVALDFGYYDAGNGTWVGDHILINNT